MGRINVFLKNKLLDGINVEAKKEGTNRNAVIQAALEKYIEGKQREREFPPAVRDFYFFTNLWYSHRQIGNAS